MKKIQNLLRFNPEHPALINLNGAGIANFRFIENNIQRGKTCQGNPAGRIKSRFADRDALFSDAKAGTFANAKKLAHGTRRGINEQRGGHGHDRTYQERD